jgi:hypothetical protein
MYLLPAGMPPRNNRKLQGLGAFRLRSGLDFWRTGRYGLRGLGDAQDPGSIDPLTGNTYASESVPGSEQAYTLYKAVNEATAALTPGTPAYQSTNSPTLQIPQSVLTNMQPSQSPLDYVSPQAAIAAGLNPQTVYNAWASGLARFPTQGAALAAGIPAGVVTQLWAQSRSAAPPATSGSFLDQAPLGVANKYLIAAGAGLFALVSLSGGRRGR